MSVCVVAQTDTSTEVRVTAELLGRGRRLCSVVPVFLENGSCLCVCVCWTQHPNRKRSPHEDVGMTLTTRQLEITVHQDPNIFGGQKNRQQRWKKKRFLGGDPVCEYKTFRRQSVTFRATDRDEPSGHRALQLCRLNCSFRFSVGVQRLSTKKMVIETCFRMLQMSSIWTVDRTFEQFPV